MSVFNPHISKPIHQKQIKTRQKALNAEFKNGELSVRLSDMEFYLPTT